MEKKKEKPTDKYEFDITLWGIIVREKKQNEKK